jgi:excisionase family DNA binding protein
VSTTAPTSPVADTERSEAGRLLTADQLAKRWQVPRSQVYRLTRSGRLSPVRVGRYYRYRLEAIEAFEIEGGSDG